MRENWCSYIGLVSKASGLRGASSLVMTALVLLVGSVKIMYHQCYSHYPPKKLGKYVSQKIKK